MNSPVRLGESTTVQPLQVFMTRGFETLFPHAGTLGCVVSLAPQLFLLVYPHADVGLPRLLAAASHRLTWSTSCHLATSPLCLGCPSPTLLPVWMNVSSLTPWLLDFYTVRFSGSSGYFYF